MILGVFAKEPRIGQSKTRLAKDTSTNWSLQVATALLEDSLDRYQGVLANRTVVFAPADSANFFERIAKSRFDLLPQENGDLGQRLRAFVDFAYDGGFNRIVVVGVDSPTLPIDYIEHAFELLKSCDVVLGPAFDGGYYLVGCGPRARDIPLFNDIPWSTSRVLTTTVDRIRMASAELELLPPWYDVDTADDWEMLVGHVRAMRRAGIDPGVPRLEALMEARK